MSRRWVVTGGSRGIGLAVAKRALAAGDRVAVLARRPPPELAATLGETPHLVLPADVSDPLSVAAAMASVAAQWGGIDVLVNNAGLHRGGKLERLPLEDWNAVLATNLSGAMHCLRAALPHMGGGASVVNVGAVVGFRGFPGDAAYGASKAGLAGLTQVMAVELASRQVRVNLVVPGFVITEMTAAVDERARERLLARIPLRREGTEDEIAEVIYWVAGSTYMTGAVIPTDGGLMCNL
ncbi:MAG: SDR family NAD(P)-dependent oxidoreductase [Steroidobacteraceae bacterium]